MYKKTIKYTDYNGIEREEDFYFNLSKSEVYELALSVDGGLVQMLEKMVSTIDVVNLVSEFKFIILKAYGEKSPDGKQFIKSEELSTAFSQTEAYTNLFMELVSDAKASSDFMNAIIPQQIIPAKQ